MVRELPLRGDESPDAFGIDFFQARGDIPRTGGELGFYIRASETDWHGGESAELVCLHGRGYFSREECGGGCYSRRFGETRGVLGTGKHGSLRFGRGTLDRGGRFEIRASGSAAREKI